MTERSCPYTHTYCFCTIHWRSSKNRHTTFSFTTKERQVFNSSSTDIKLSTITLVKHCVLVVYLQLLAIRVSVTGEA